MVEQKFETKKLKGKIEVYGEEGKEKDWSNEAFITIRRKDNERFTKEDLEELVTDLKDMSKWRLYRELKKDLKS